MDIKKSPVLIAAVIGVVLVIFLFNHVRNIFKESDAASRPVVPVQQAKIPPKEPSVGYSIPGDATSAPRQASVNKAEEQRAVAKTINDAMESQRLKRRAEVFQKEPEVIATAEAKSKDKTVIIPTKDPVRFPTYNERKTSASRGVIAF